MAIQFTRNGRKAMLWAQVEAMRRGEAYVERSHLLLGLLHGEETSALRLLERLGCDASELRRATVEAMKPEGIVRTETSQLAPATRKVIEQARRETEGTGHDYVGTEHLLLALLRDADDLPMLAETGVTFDGASQLVAAGMAAAEDRPERPEPYAQARPGFLKGRSLVSIADLTAAEVQSLFELTRAVKMGRLGPVASGKTAALLFEKSSLRTKVSFQVAMTRLGGASIYLGRDEVGLGQREAIQDVARVLSRMVDAVVVRTFDHAVLAELAHWSVIPVINALDDAEHPCQALADFYTILEHRAETHGQKLVYVGDGNNVAVSLMLLAPLLGTHLTIACPPGYEPPAEAMAQASERARQHGTKLEIVHDPVAAADDADVLYTDVWTSMGQEAEREKRLRDFEGFCIDHRLLREAKEDAIVLHCLPAHRGEEIAEEALEGPNSRVFDQAENRLHVQQALLAAVL